MTNEMLVGLAILGAGAALSGIAIAARFGLVALLYGVMVSELGAMFVLRAIFPSEAAKIAVSLFFFVSVSWTFVMQLQARRKSVGTPNT